MDLKDLAEKELIGMANKAIEEGFDSLTDEEKHAEFVKLLNRERVVDNATLMDLLVTTYTKTVNDNKDDFLCLSEMIVSLIALLRVKGILGEEEAQYLYDIPKKNLGEVEK